MRELVHIIVNFEETLSRVRGKFEKQNNALQPSIIIINYCVIALLLLFIIIMHFIIVLYNKCIVLLLYYIVLLKKFSSRNANKSGNMEVTGAATISCLKTSL